MLDDIDVKKELPKVSFKYDSVKVISENTVNHPPHYTANGIECIDAIRASMTDIEFEGYCKGNIEKYLWRYKMKNGLEDLEKAQVYLTWLLNTLKGEDLIK